jgi:putative MATE family efflux protein
MVMRAARADLLGDRHFYSTLFSLTLPIAAQSLVMNLLNAVDVLIIGQLGDTAVASVGLANQVYFLMSIFLFGVGSGALIFAAQFWGRGDLANLRRTLGMALQIGVAGSLVFTVAALAIPRTLLGLYSQDPAVIAAGSPYLRLVSLCYLPTAISTIYGTILRSARHVKAPTLVSAGALSFKTALAFVLIFGYFGFPAMGIMGAALATCIARLLECAAMLAVTYLGRTPAAVPLRDLVAGRPAFLGQFMRTSLPVVAGEILWSLGTTTYSAVYAHIGTQSVTATSIAGTIESLAMVPFFGMGTACAVFMGNYLGGSDAAHARLYARRFIILAVLGGGVCGLLMLLISGWALGLYQISAEAQFFAHRVVLVSAGVLWLKATNITMVVGIMRSGGDTRFALFADTAPMWTIGIPLAALLAFVFHLPVYLVVLVAFADEGTKFVVCLWRVSSGIWIRNVVQRI